METEKSKILTDQNVRFFIQVVIFMFPLFLAWASIETKLALIQQELTTIKSNDLAHIEIELSDMKARNTVADNKQTNIEMQVTRLITIHEKQ
jgi:hypothetical protein